MKRKNQSSSGPAKKITKVSIKPVKKKAVATPFVWQIKTSNTWIALPQQDDIERTFADVNRVSFSSFSARRSTNRFRKVCNSCTLSFAKLTRTCKANCGRNEIRRFSSPQSQTQWEWYYRAHGANWQMHPQSAAIEKAHQSKLARLKLTDPRTGHTHSIHFGLMVVTCSNCKSRKDLRRRPLTNSSQKPFEKKTKENSKSATSASTETSRGKADVVVPQFWGQNQKSVFVPLEELSAEYKYICKKFMTSMRLNHQVVLIERVQNAELWTEYTAMKNKMLRRRGFMNGDRNPRTATEALRLCSTLREKFLFHGTDRDSVNSICTLRGFDWRLSGRNATMYGQGSYFARDAATSLNWTRGSQLIIVARVLVGDSALGTFNCVMPPARDPSNPLGERFDSCVDFLSNPSIFVTFEFGQSYPAYIIHFMNK